MAIYIFDLDKTLCYADECSDEAIKNSKPYEDRIAKVNRLYDEGHTIIIDSARGTMTGFKWNRITKQQLKKWGVKYHHLRTGVKFFGDVYVDNSAINDLDFFKQ